MQYFFPSNRLADALSKAPARTVKQCLAQADENLRHIKSACSDHIDRHLDMLEATVKAWPAAPDEDYLRSVYQLALRIIGVATVAGLPDLDTAAASLCDVADGMQAKAVWEREPLEVHVASMRLLRQPRDLGGGASSIIEGLLKVRKRFAFEAPQATKPASAKT